MYATNVRDLKKNPSAALRHARNELIATDVAFNDMANAVRLIENAPKG